MIEVYRDYSTAQIFI